MTEEKFRIIYSTLIEQYQFIEFHLEGIYAFISDKGFAHGLEDVEKSSISRVIKENKKNHAVKEIFSKEEYIRLDNINKRRNFWIHNCYVDLEFDNKVCLPKHKEVIQRLLNDLREAE